MIGDRLKKLRLGAGLDQKQFGKIAGTTKQYVSQLESGRNKKPNAEYIERWASHFRVRMEWITTGKGQQEADAQSDSSSEASSDDNDIKAIHMVLGELVRVMVSSAPNEARAFAALLKDRADGDEFSTETAGLVKEVLRTVELGQRRAEAAVERASQQVAARKAS